MKASVLRRRVLLGVLLCATVATTFWIGHEEPVHVISDAAAPRTPLIPGSADGPAPEAVQLGRLKRRASQEPDVDAFNIRNWEAPPAPALPTVVAAVPLAPPAAPPLPFTYMGHLRESPDGHVTVYLLQGEQSHVVRQGDIINQTYRVDAVSAEQVVFTYLPMKLTQILSYGSS